MNGKTFVLYTTEERGRFKVSKATEDEYIDAVTSGQWDETPSYVPSGSQMVDLVFVALLRVESNFDFINGRPRDVVKAA